MQTRHHDEKIAPRTAHGREATPRKLTAGGRINTEGGEATRAYRRSDKRRAKSKTLRTHRTGR